MLLSKNAATFCDVLVKLETTDLARTGTAVLSNQKYYGSKKYRLTAAGYTLVANQVYDAVTSLITVDTTGA